MVKVKALQRVYHGGHEYAPGEELDVSPVQAAQLTLIRKVVRAEGGTPEPGKPDKAPPPPPPPRHPEPEPEDVPEPEPPEPEHNAKGRHKRRDMRAER